MTAAELLTALVQAKDRAARQPLLDRLARDYGAKPEFPALLRKLPASLRLMLSARALEMLPDSPANVRPILAAVTHGLGKSRTLQRLIELQCRVIKCDVLDAAVQAAEKRTKLACPKCAAKLPRPTLIRHLWFKHRLIFEKGRAREPGPLVEAVLQRAIASDDPAALDHAYDFAGVYFRKAEPIQVHQALTARIDADVEDLEPLRAHAKEQACGLCPRCLSPMPNPVPPLPPPLIVSHGRLVGEGFEHDPQRDRTARRQATLAALPVAILSLFAVLALPKTVLHPLATLALGTVGTGLVYGFMRRHRRSTGQPDDAVVDSAWRDLVPRVGRSAAAVRFLTRLCQSSLVHGDPLARTDAVWSQVEQAAVLSGKSGTHLQWFAAVRVLQAHDAGQIGQDWIPSLVGILAPLFRAEVSPAYAEAVAETLDNAHITTDRDGARLRILLVEEAFAAGLSPDDLGDLVSVCPHLGRLFAGNLEWFRSLHLVWRERNRRSWNAVAEAKTVFEYAANPAAGGTLAYYPDTLLVHRFEESFDREFGPVLIGRRGVTVADTTVSDTNTAISVEHEGEGSVLRFGPHAISSRRKLPKKVASLLTDWLQFRDELLAREPSSHRSERLPAILAPIVADCPLCRMQSLVRVGELNSTWPINPS